MPFSNKPVGIAIIEALVISYGHWSEVANDTPADGKCVSIEVVHREKVPSASTGS